jgi:hypothetical protein
MEEAPEWVRIADMAGALGRLGRWEYATLPKDRPTFLEGLPSEVPHGGFDVDGDASIMCHVLDDGSFVGAMVRWFGFELAGRPAMLVRATDYWTAVRHAGLHGEYPLAYEGPEFKLTFS